MPKKHLTDEQLAESWMRLGDASAIDEMVRRYAKPLTGRAVNRYGINPADAEELVNDLFMGLKEKLKAFDLNGKFRPWIRETFKNVCMDRHKKEDGRNPKEDPDTITARPTPLDVNLDPTAPAAPFPAIHLLSELHSRDPFYSGESIENIAVAKRQRRRADEMMEQFDHPIPEDWEEGLKEEIGKWNFSSKATMLKLIDGKRTRPLVAEAAAILWRAYVGTPKRFCENLLEFRGLDLYPATQFTAILHGALWEVAIGQSPHYAAMAKRASKTKPPKIGLHRTLLGLRASFLRDFGHPVDEAVALLLRAGFGGKWTAKMVQARASDLGGKVF